MIYYYKREIARINEEEIQICNLCKCNLNIRYGYKNNIILSCSNSECKSKINRNYKWLAFYDYDIYLKKIENINSKKVTRLQKSYWINKGYSEEEAIKKISNIQSENSKKVKNRVSCMTKKYWIEKGYSEKEAIKKISNIGKENSKRCIEYWIKRGYSKEEAKKFIAKYQNNSKFIDYKNINHPKKLSYWLKFCIDEEEAKKLHKAYCKEKYSVTIEKIGEDKYNKMILNRKITYNKHSDENKIKINKSKGRTFEQLEKEKGIDKALEILHKRISKGYSNISKELFDNLIDNNNKYYYAENEYRIKNENYVYYVDFKTENKIIEFYGTKFHADKRFYKEQDNPNPYIKELTAKEIWEKDESRINNIIKEGYNILIVWEYDYLQNKKEMIEKCKNFLKLN